MPQAQACRGKAPLGSRLVDSITGPVARAAAVIAIVISGVTIIFGEGGGGMRKLAFVGLGIAIMFAAVSFFLDFLRLRRRGGALMRTKPLDEPEDYRMPLRTSLTRPILLGRRAARVCDPQRHGRRGDRLWSATAVDRLSALGDACKAPRRGRPRAIPGSWTPGRAHHGQAFLF
jgi:type IV secretory pathway VirB2 component (pilin)